MILNFGSIFFSTLDHRARLGNSMNALSLHTRTLLLWQGPGQLTWGQAQSLALAEFRLHTRTLLLWQGPGELTWGEAQSLALADEDDEAEGSQGYQGDEEEGSADSQ